MRKLRTGLALLETTDKYLRISCRIQWRVLLGALAMPGFTMPSFGQKAEDQRRRSGWYGLAGTPFVLLGPHASARRMTDEDRVVTAKLPNKLAVKLDEVAGRIDRSRSWIIRQALSEWIAEEQRRHELTLEALKSVDEGQTIPHEDVLAWFEGQRVERKKSRETSNKKKRGPGSSPR